VAAALERDGGPAEQARLVIERMPPRDRARLQAQLAGNRSEAAGHERRPGLGIGSLVLILLAAGAFMVYGAYHDIDPFWRGKRDLRLGDFASARAAFAELGALPDARMWTAIAWLAEGRYDEAFGIVHDPAVRKALAQFRPMDEPIEPVEADPESGALLPRGPTTITRPTFVYEAGPGGALTLVWSSLDDPDAVQRTLRFPVTDTLVGPDGTARLEYPSDRSALEAGLYQWWVPGSEGRPATFMLLDKERRREIQNRSMYVQRQEIPAAARTFLRAHYYLRNRLYMQAGEHFADLALEFTRERYPRRMLSEVASALGVDPSVFLR
jgi:hypothetical protein